MADRYDDNSRDHIGEFKDAKDPQSDIWANLVTHITGYPVPDRATVFDTLRSDHGGKLFRMDIQQHSLSNAVKDSGFLQNSGEDYDIYFFDSGKKTVIKQARIVFEGRVKSGDEIHFADPGSDDYADASVGSGNEFTDYNKDKMSTVALARYMNGPREALMKLLAGGTGDARFSNVGVAEDAAVDLNSFDRTGESFDYAAKFFRETKEVLEDWEKRFGGDGASWKGEAAEVFRNLLKKVRENYESYIETFDETAGDADGTGKGATVYSRALSLGRTYLENSAEELLQAWSKWANSPYYDPVQVLRYVLDDLAMWVDENNVAKTDIQTTTSMYSSSTYHTPKDGFSQSHPEYGDLTDIENWSKVGDKAVKIWNQGIDEYLGEPARTVQSNLNNHFLDLSKDFSGNVPEPKSTGTASDDYEKQQAEDEEKRIEEENEKNRQEQEDLRDEQNKQREEDKAYQDELRKEQEEQRNEDKAYQDELRKEQEEQRNEDKAYQEELREEQRKQQEEAQREADEQAKNLQNSLGDINGGGGVGGGGDQNLDKLDDYLKQNGPSTENLGSIDGLNGGGQGGGGQGGGGLDGGGLDGGGQNNPVTESLGDLDGLNGGGDQQQGNGDLNGLGNNPAVPITQSLGNLGNLNGGGGSGGNALKTPTGGNTRLDGDKLNTDFEDGSKTSFDPETGEVTTTNPDGSTTTTDLGNGKELLNPDGSRTTLGDDGKLTTTFPDGTTQTVDPGTGQSLTTNPDGSTHTDNLGSLQGLNNGANNDAANNALNEQLGNSTLDTPTGGHTQLTGNGDLATDFPDGSESSFNPDDSTLTTTGPDGSSNTVDLGDGHSVTNPDGSVTSLGDDGKLTTTFPDGSSQTVDPSNGQATTTDPDGRTTTSNLGSLGDLNGNNNVNDLNGLGNNDLGDLGNIGSHIPTTSDLGSLGDLNSGNSLDTPTGGHTGMDGKDFATTFPDGGQSSFDPDTGALTLTGPDGATTTTDLTHGASVHNPDGSTTTLDNGQLTTTYPDGSTQTIDPDTGLATTTDAQGHTEKVNLHDLNGDLNSGGSSNSDPLGDLKDLNLTGGDPPSTQHVPTSDLNLAAGGSNGSTQSLGSSLGPGGNGSDSLGAVDGNNVAPLSDGSASNSSPNSGGGGAQQPGTPGAPGTPGTPGMPMGGGGGMGAGGAEKGNGERVRAVLVDAAEESERRNRRRRNPWNRQEDSDTFLSPASRVATTTSGGSHDSTGQDAETTGRRTTSSADYLEEDADVWGTDEGGAPAVIGR
ncbi:AAWKG family protein [Streptomyces sp. NPDC102364]|uniref:AAWKG family protein n=1 Tax=Streptomyces sp. NPDC102364 TaxID=3366161 RepID=UPI0038272735